MNNETHDWLRRRTLRAASLTPAELATRLRSAGLTVSAVLPAIDEAPTVGEICRVISDELVAPGAVDQVVVIDSGSHDGTPQIAAQAGAEVCAAGWPSR